MPDSVRLGDDVDDTGTTNYVCGWFVKRLSIGGTSGKVYRPGPDPSDTGPCPVRYCRGWGRWKWVSRPSSGRTGRPRSRPCYDSSPPHRIGSLIPVPLSTRGSSPTPFITVSERPVTPRRGPVPDNDDDGEVMCKFTFKKSSVVFITQFFFFF